MPLPASATEVSSAPTASADGTAAPAQYRLPVAGDVCKIRLGGGYRLPVAAADPCRVRLGGGYRLPIPAV